MLTQLGQHISLEPCVLTTTSLPSKNKFSEPAVVMLLYITLQYSNVCVITSPSVDMCNILFFVYEGANKQTGDNNVANKETRQRTNKRTNEQTNKQTNERTNERTNKELYIEREIKLKNIILP